MTTFFNPTTARIQPLAQEGVVDTYRQPSINGYSLEAQNIPTTSSFLMIGPATATGVMQLLVTINSAYLPFAGQNIRTVNLSVVNGDTATVLAAKAAAALSSDLLFSGYFSIVVSGAQITLRARQAYQPGNNITAISTANIIAGVALSTSIGAAAVAQPRIPVGRLVYTAAGSPETSIRLLQVGASGVLRGITSWCDEVPYDYLTKTSGTPAFWRQDVLEAGVINLDGTVPVTARPAVGIPLSVVISGPDLGKIVPSTAPNSIALSAANFPNISNMFPSMFSIYELSRGTSNLYKLQLGVI